MYASQRVKSFCSSRVFFRRCSFPSEPLEKLLNNLSTSPCVSLTLWYVSNLSLKLLKDSEGKEHLLKNTLEKQNDLTLWDIYNSLTNYSSHNKRAISVGKRNAKVKKFDIRDSSMDNIRSDDKRTAEVQDFIKSNTFLFFVHQGISNTLR